MSFFHTADVIIITRAKGALVSKEPVTFAVMVGHFETEYEGIVEKVVEAGKVNGQTMHRVEMGPVPWHKRRPKRPQ